MCGGEPNIRIERAGNGFLIDSYSPGGPDRPGVHKRHVATNPGHALTLVKKHLSAKKKGKAKAARKRG